MKKLALLLLAVLFISCSTDEASSNNEPDCNCDRVLEVNTFTIVGTPQNPALNYYSVYVTINDCTQIQRQKTFTTTNPNLSPKLNECR